MANRFPIKNPNVWTLQDDIALLTITQQTGKQFTFVVDAGAVQLLAPFQWYVDAKSDTLIYAATSYKNRNLLLHRMLAIATTPDVDPRKLVTDHISRDTLDNRLSNLRLCSHSINAKNCNRKPRVKKEAPCPTHP